MGITRRSLLARTSQAGFGIALTGSLNALLGSPAAGAPPPAGFTGYGPLVDDPDGRLALPKGFSYRVVTEAGKTRLYSKDPSPGSHDGAAAFEAPDGNVLLVLNHEVRGGPDDDGAVPHLSGYTWRDDAGGGCTVVKTTPDGELIWETVALAGTSTNCAGGVTPWGTWLTCEETEDDGHGWVFEVDPVDLTTNLKPTPIRALGRFVHEACCIDPDTLAIYLTEDAADPYGTVYRWTPPAKFRGASGALKQLDADAGQLAAMACTDTDGNLVDDLDRADEPDIIYTVAWIPVGDRTAENGSLRSLDGITRAAKLEGAWWADDGAYLVSSYADSHRGQIWHYNPAEATLTLTTEFAVDADGETVEAPDNIVAAPYGGLIVSTDGDGDNHLAGITPAGTAYPLARSQMGSEFTGPTFSPDGRVLFAGIQKPGVLFAIIGPWQEPARPGTADSSADAGSPGGRARRQSQSPVSASSRESTSQTRAPTSGRSSSLSAAGSTAQPATAQGSFR